MCVVRTIRESSVREQSTHVVQTLAIMEEHVMSQLPVSPARARHHTLEGHVTVVLAPAHLSLVAIMAHVSVTKTNTTFAYALMDTRAGIVTSE